MIRMVPAHLVSRLLAAALASLVALAAAHAPAAGQQPPGVSGVHGALPPGMDCSACHTAQGWTPVRDSLAFTHGAVSGFRLTGAHELVGCRGCHQDLRFDGPQVGPEDCASCHADVHEGRLLEPCAACHGTTSFLDVDGERVHARTAFPLTGAHRQITCESCHADDRGGAFSPLDPECASCHLDAYENAVTVDHLGGGYPTDCTRCHGTVAWADAATFDHVEASGFPLLGAHDDLRCASCHTPPAMTLVYQPASPDDCVACHQADYDEEHPGSGFPTTCLSCHTVNDWDAGSFDHTSTAFPLVGAHVSEDCSACHGPPEHLAARFTTPDDCVACHQSDYDEKHAGSGFPTTCLSCHNQSDWDSGSFDHGALAAGFVLDGPHAALSCQGCHAPGTFDLVFPAPADGRDCVACHQADFDQQHGASALSTDCLSCHAADRWDGATLDHTAVSGGFALLGRHETAACAACHTVPGYALLFPEPLNTEDCVACHQSDYDQKHAGSGFPTTCLSCHSQSDWDAGSFDHGALAGGFALLGPHEPLPCASCHAEPGYTLLFPPPSFQDDCVACHQGDFDARHAGSGFPTTCLSCHAADTWTGATLDHTTVSGGFALLGRHETATCAACHALPGYGLLFPRPMNTEDCVACHRAEYDGTHASEGYPTGCVACHTPQGWTPSTFDHDARFPIYSGRHQTEWSTCADCHVSPADAAVVSCLTCHEHNQTKMDDTHKERDGYSYTTAACLSCHPTGDA